MLIKHSALPTVCLVLYFMYSTGNNAFTYNFVWIDQRVLFRCEPCFINWPTVLHETSKLIVMDGTYHHLLSKYITPLII